MEALTDELAFEQGFSITLNEEKDPLFYRFDYDVRTENVNMQFQHFHEFYEMMVLLDDTAGHLIEGQYYSLQKYDIVLLRPGRLHKSIYFKGGPVRRIIISFKFPALYGVANAVKGILGIFDSPVPIMRFDVDDRQMLFRHLNSLFTAKHERLPFSEILVFSEFLGFLYDMQAMEKKNVYKESTRFDPVTHKMYLVSSYIHSHYKETLSLDQLAEQFSISPCYLSRKFKQVLGFSLVQYILMTRLRSAQRLLLSSSKPIPLIAEESGFNSSSHFNRMFFKYCGMSPTLYKKQSKENRLVPEANIFSL